MASESKAVFGREWIEARIPHRAPFLLVDRVLDMTAERIETEWTVSPDAEFFKGHYPGEPILPGVLATEFLVQSGAVLVCDPEAEWAQSGAIPVLVRMRDARFRQMVRPGERLRGTVTLEDRVGPAYHMKGEVRNEQGEKVASVRYVVSIAERKA